MLYAGIILTSQGPRVLEFNVRFGDPECQALLVRLKSDLVDVLEAIVDERLDRAAIEWDPRPSVALVLAAEGYPGTFERGRPIHNIEEADALPNVKVFHSGTTMRPDLAGDRDSRLVTDAGRVLTVSCLGKRSARPAKTRMPPRHHSVSRKLVPRRRGRSQQFGLKSGCDFAWSFMPSLSG